MAGKETGINYGPKDNGVLRTTAYLMAIEANRNNMINGDVVPFVIFKEKKKIERSNEQKIHEESLKQTYAIHQLINDMKSVHVKKSASIGGEEIPEIDADYAPRIIFESGPKFSSDPATGNVIITNKKGKTFEPTFDDKGVIDKLKIYTKAKDATLILQKIKNVELLSKDLIYKSVKCGIDSSGYCAAIDALHQISSSGDYNTANISLAAEYAQGKLKEDFLIAPHGTHLQIAKIENTLHELSKI